MSAAIGAWGEGHVHGLLVVEDDAALSPDVIEFAQYAAARAAVPLGPPAATSLMLRRSETADPARHARIQRVQKAGGEFGWAHGRLVEALRMEQDVMVFKTFAWVAGTMDAAGRVAEALRAVDGWEHPTLLHPMFSLDCHFCCNHCYDHVIETVFAGETILAPWVPRATQTSKGGMTEAADEATSNPYALDANTVEPFSETLPVELR